MEQKKYMVNARTGEVRATYKLAYFTEHDKGVVWFEQETLPTNTNPDYLKIENEIVVDKTQAEIDLFDANKSIGKKILASGNGRCNIFRGRRARFCYTLEC